jgi:hypothetical protein
MTAIDSVTLVKEVLVAYGYDVEPGDDIAKRALSSQGYVFVSELNGTTPHIEVSYRPSIQIVVYSTLGKRAAVMLSSRIQSDLRSARGTVYPSGGIHRVITRISPYRQDLPGIPSGVGRAVAQYELVLSTIEKWSN